jgi:uncharacterized protein (TIGR03437 family)
MSVAVDVDGNLYIADTFSEVIRKVSPDGVIQTIAGNYDFVLGYSGDGGPATDAQLQFPQGIAVDKVGNIYVTDPGDGNIWNDSGRSGGAVRLLEPIGPPPSVSSIVDAASGLAGPVAPGEIVVLSGAQLGPPILTHYTVNDMLAVGAQLSGCRVLFGAASAPILYTSETQVSVVVPYSVAAADVPVTLEFQGQASVPLTIAVAPAAPALFTTDSSGAGQAAAINQDGSINSAANPARVGETISLFATGVGQTSPTGIDGKLGGNTPPQPLSLVTVTVGGMPAQVRYAGGVPWVVAGMTRIDALIQSGVQPGATVPVAVQVGGSPTRADVTIAVAQN